jgi:hypothetical protein
MKHCPKCKSQLPDEMTFCLIDGETLLINDPEAITLKGEGPRRLKSIPIIGESFRKMVTLTMDRPYSLVHPGIIVVFILKGMWMDNNDNPTAHIGIYGSNINFQPGRRIKMSEQNEYVMCLPTDFTDSDCIFSFTVGIGFCHLFRLFAQTIDLTKGKVRLDIELLITEPVGSRLN